MYLNLNNDDIKLKFSRKFMKKMNELDFRKGYLMPKRQIDLMMPSFTRIASDYWSQNIEKNGIKLYADMLFTLYETQFEYLLNMNGTFHQNGNCTYSDEWYLFTKDENGYWEDHYENK